jgi:hypothetical protein
MVAEFGLYFNRLIDCINVLCIDGLFRFHCLANVWEVELSSVSQGRHWVQFDVHWLLVEFLLASNELGGDRSLAQRVVVKRAIRFSF